ncbi:hypothetical protein SAMN02910265_00223 [Ruminococcus flavefaciens]|uniref:CRISPR-associated protein Cas4 n=1 Tax=Ruminococcus flavefaciens TaxID=1265 RepID=A0A1H6HS10_RUMFL|nr:hypothetical protein [Ruminococcus flavefaciens]SEH38315.1 hypothetical protein SAMN02910265_00223 [Ruminococcus flavefaciens]
MSDSTINIRTIQHYMYCPRRFALLEVNSDWAENAFIVKLIFSTNTYTTEVTVFLTVKR